MFLFCCFTFKPLHIKKYIYSFIKKKEMNRRFLLLVLSLLPLIATAQGRADYEHVMKTFIRFYNAHQYDSIYNMFSDHDKKYDSPERNKSGIKWYEDKEGDIVSYEYLGIDTTDPNKATVFLTKWSKGGKRTSSFSLDKHNKFLTWRMITSSGGIDAMLSAKNIKDVRRAGE